MAYSYYKSASFNIEAVYMWILKYYHDNKEIVTIGTINRIHKYAI